LNDAMVISIKDVTGKEVISEKYRNQNLIEINTSMLQAGYYFLEIEGAKINAVRKFIVQ